jgi:hypothetical protein
MFTQKELVQAQNEARPFMTKCDEYRALIAEHELPLSLDINTLTAALKSQQFTKLLAVDAGLKMRYEMLRTEEAQQQLINDTINLNGYDIVPNLERRITELQALYGRMMLYSCNSWIVPERNGMPLSMLASHHNLDLTNWLQSQLINWTGKEHVLAYFTTLAKQVSQVRAIVRATRDSGATLATVLGMRTTIFFTEASNAGPVEPNEHYITRDLIPYLEDRGRLKDFPKNFN